MFNDERLSLMVAAAARVATLGMAGQRAVNGTQPAALRIL
jgi:hypothetical protein